MDNAVTQAFTLALKRTERALYVATDGIADRTYRSFTRTLHCGVNQSTGADRGGEHRVGHVAAGSDATTRPEPAVWKENSAPPTATNTRPDALLHRGRLVPELGEEVSELAKLSPTLTTALSEIRRTGWTIEYGRPGDGSYADRESQRIVVDPIWQNDNRKQTAILAEEVGHATNPNPPRELPYRGGDPEEWVEHNVAEHLNDEGEAKLFGVQVFLEVEHNGGPYIPVGGRHYSEYERIYQEFTEGALSRDQARELIAGFHDLEETGSGTTQSYGDYWRSHFMGVYMNKYGAGGGTPH